MKKIKLRFYITHFQPIYTGAGKSLEKLINALDKNKFEIEVLTSCKKGLKKIEKRDGFIIIRVGNGFFLKSGYLSALGKLDFSFFSFWYNLTHLNFDIINFIGVGKISLPSIITAKLLKKPIVNKSTAAGDDDPIKLSKDLIGKFIINLLSKNTAHWVISKEIYDNSIHFTNWSKDSFFLITNPVRIHFVSYTELKKENILHKNKKIKFLFVGVLNKRKGVDILFNIWKKNKPNAELILCGPIGKDESINSQIESLLDYDINYLGELDRNQVIDQYLKADYFIFPSKREGMPNVVLESMSFGLPVIANKIEGVTDFLLEDNRGILIKDNNINEWERVINNLILNNEKLEKEAFAAYNWVVKNSSFEAVGKKMEEMYIKLLKNEF